MENYQTLFPISSPEAAALSANYPDLSTNYMAPNSQVMFNNFQRNNINDSNGLVGLKTENFIQIPAEVNKELVGNWGFGGSETDDQMKPVAAAGNKKKALINKKIKKPKYAFQTRSQVDILDDGYRWRKYGQKAVKNNKFPR